MFVVIGLFASFLLSIVVAVIASGRGRSGIGFFLLSMVFTPIIAIIVLLLMGKSGPESSSLDKVDHIYWCPSCDSTYSDYNNKNVSCPSCHNELSETTVLAVDWRKQSPEGKTALKKAFARGEYLRNDDSITEPAHIGNITSSPACVENKPTESNTVDNMSVVEEIAKCKELLDAGAITQEEYESLKKNILIKKD